MSSKVSKALKSTTSSSWFCRVDGDVDVLRPKVTQLAGCIDVVSLIVTHHTGKKKENPHIHFCINLNYEPQKQSFAVRIKKLFEVVDRGYALDVWDARRAEYGAVSYLFHEEDAPLLCSKGWELSEIQAAKHIAEQTNIAVNEQKEKASTKLVDKALVQFFGQVPTKMEVFKFMLISVHKKESYWPGQYKIKQMVEEVEIKLSDNINNLAYHLYNEIWR